MRVLGNPGSAPGRISTNREGTKRYFHFDGLGSTRALTDSSETITDTYEYNAFGVVESSSGTSVNPYRYVGQYGYYDDGAMGSSSGLLLLGVRYYSPAHGRFWSWDPVPNLNLYAYVDNSATMAIDPSGGEAQQPKDDLPGMVIPSWNACLECFLRRCAGCRGWECALCLAANCSDVCGTRTPEWLQCLLCSMDKCRAACARLETSEEQLRCWQCVASRCPTCRLPRPAFELPLPGDRVKVEFGFWPWTREGVPGIGGGVTIRW